MAIENQKQRLERHLIETVDYYRGLCLDLAEQQFGGTDEWPFVRARLLKLWGDRGLTGRLIEVIRRELSGSVGEN